MSSLRPPEATPQKKGPEIVTGLDLAGPKPTVRTILPHAVAVLWLLLLALEIWPMVQQSVQPPVYDTLTYFQKAKNFWAAVSMLKLTNPLNLEPVFRPPGTILMSYPVGFTNDFHGFYFRSIFIPILLLVAAVYCAGSARRASPRWHWNLALIAMLLSSSPMFFHFERSEAFVSPLIWGLVDNFIAAVAGIAAALCIRSVRSGSLRMWVGAVLVASFSIFVKPAGALVMALTGSMWFLSNLLWGRLERESHKERKTVLWLGSTTALLIFGISMLLCFRSKYLSPASLSYGSAAIDVMRAELRLPLPLFFRLIRASFGYVLPIAVALAWICGLLYLFHSRKNASSSRAKNTMLTMLLTAPLTCAIGLWFWIVAAAGATQIRYFFPFAIMTAIFTVPGLLILLEDIPRWGLWLVRAAFLVPVLNLLLLLTVPNPSLAWQRVSGVNLTTGTFRAEILMAQQLVADIRSKLDRNAFLYSFYSGASTAVFESVGQFEGVTHPQLPTFQIVRPVDWRKPSVFRINDLLESDYILFTPVLDPVARERTVRQDVVPDFWRENAVFHAWFTELSDKDGVATIAQSPSIRVLHPVDVQQFENRLNTFVASHSWPASFTQANPQHWWSAEEIESMRLHSTPAISKVKFGELYELNAVSSSRDGDELTLRFWWQCLKKEEPNQNSQHPWVIFIHFLDKTGKVLWVENMRLAAEVPADENRPIALDVLTIPVPKGTTKLALGIYNGEEFLIPDHGTRDWNNRRLLLPLP